MILNLHKQTKLFLVYFNVFIFIDSSLFLKFDIGIIYVECVLIMNRVRYPNLLSTLNFQFQPVSFEILFSLSFYVAKGREKTFWSFLHASSPKSSHARSRFESHCCFIFLKFAFCLISFYASRDISNFWREA